MLASPRNAGLRTYVGDEKGQEELRDAAWPAIVPRDIWQGVRDILADEDRLCGTSRARKHLLSNIAVCGLCGAGLGSGVNSHGGLVYLCKNCNRVSRNGAALDAFVVEAVVARLSRPDAIELTRPEQRDDLNELREQGRALRARLEALGTEFADGELPASVLKSATKRITEKLAVIDAALRDAQTTHVFDGVIGAADVDAAFDALDLDRKRAVISALVSITVHPTGRGARKFRAEDVQIRFLG